MKKRYSLIIVMAMFIACAFADPVTKSAARQIAKKFLSEQGKSVKSEPARAARVHPSNTLEEVPAYYVFNSSDNKSFVIVSGDDQTEQILGYSMNGAFDENDLPENLKAWLQGYAEEIEMIISGRGVPAKVQLHSSSIGQRMSTTWNQSSPYNGMCVFNGNTCVTGCTATAISQVMKYHRWPTAATTSVPGYTTSTYGYVLEELPSTTFDWNNMLNDYVSGGYTSTQATAVATLMRYVGQGAKMNYGPSSGAGFGNAIHALTNYFDYNKDITYEKSASYTIQNWDNLIYNELTMRPVVYEGYSTGGGHAFVIDGYDSSNGMYYVNWGWGGSKDGWYRLRIMDPDGGGIGASTTSDGYSNGQGAIIGLKPNDGSTTSTGRYLRGYGNIYVSYSDEAPCGSMCSHYQNPYCERLSFDIALARLNPDKSIAEVFDEYTHSDVTYSGFYTTAYYPDPNYGLTAGNKYYFALVSRENGDTEWKKAFGDNQYFEMRFNSYEDYELIVHPIAKLVSTSTNVSGENRVLLTSSFNVELSNQGEDFDNTVYVLVKEPGEEEYSVLGRTGLVIEAGNTGGVSFPITPEVEGTHYLRLAYDEEGKNVITETSVEIQKPIFATAGLTYGVEDNNINITFENNNDVEYYGYLVIQLYGVNSKGSLSFIKQINSYGGISPGTSQAVAFDPESNLDPGNYMARIWYNPNFTSEWNLTKLQDLYFTVDNEGKAVVAVDAIEMDEVENAVTPYYFSIDGKKWGTKPSKKGIYIHNGKKIIIK